MIFFQNFSDVQAISFDHLDTLVKKSILEKYIFHKDREREKVYKKYLYVQNTTLFALYQSGDSSRATRDNLTFRLFYWRSSCRRVLLRR